MTYRETCAEDCPGCGAKVLAGDNYCRRCGTDLDGVFGRAEDA